MKRSIQYFASAIAALLVLGSAHLNAADKVKNNANSGTNLAVQYCLDQGGEVETRRPYYGTNGSGALRLAGSKFFCQFTSAEDGSRIHILVSDLYTTNPSLAALAYYAELPYNGQCQGNPASCYCTQLGGSDQFGGTTGAGGGWVKDKTVDVVLEACIFPDLSSIDSWGLFYHSADIVRGKDLDGVMRYPNPYASKKNQK